MDDLGLLYTDTAYVNTPAERDAAARVVARHGDVEVARMLGLNR
jgi:hypothetical protein